MKTAALIAALIVTAVSLQAAETGLAKLKETYARETQKLDAQFEASATKVLAAYGKALDGAVESLKKEGDPDAVLQALVEKKRFGSERTVPAEPNAKLPQLMQDVQASYLKAVGKVAAEKAHAIADLTPNYIAALERLMKALTAQEKLDLALNVKTEKERAEFVLAGVVSMLETSERRSRIEIAKAAVDAQRTRIPRDAAEWNGHHYLFANGGASWQLAKARCEAMGGHLVTIQSKEENAFVTTITRGPELNVWMGATDEAQEGRWRWITGEPFSYVNWFKSQPNGGRKQNYICITRHGSAYAGGWGDVPAERTKYTAGYICEWDF
jgi:hypothetical protein